MLFIRGSQPIVKVWQKLAESHLPRGRRDPLDTTARQRDGMIAISEEKATRLSGLKGKLSPAYPPGRVAYIAGGRYQIIKSTVGEISEAASNLRQCL